MTIKKRLFLSNLWMILVPVICTGLIGLCCVGFLWFSLLRGVGLGIHDQEEFEWACMGLAEETKACLEDGDMAPIEALLRSNGMSMQLETDDRICYTFGEESEEDLRQAAAVLGNEVTILRGGGGFYTHQLCVNGTDYVLCLSGGYRGPRSYATIKTAIAFAAVIIVFTIFASILVTNRFLTRFVLQQIEQPLELLTRAIHALRDGELDWRIAYYRQDEFLPVCDGFNEMAARLQASVERQQREERSRRELIAGISHDIRSPLTSIRAYVEGLLDGVAKNPEAQRHYLEVICAKAEDLEHMVSQLFLFSKLELGEGADNPCRIRLDETIADAVESLRAECETRGMTLTTELEPVTLEADPLWVQRIVGNLLENSLKYKTADAGHVDISLRCIGQMVRLTVADDGPGVPEDALPHLFEVFYRADPHRIETVWGAGYRFRSTV